jgi:hypothetical protein
MARFARNDARYWQDRVFLPKYTRNGEQHTSRHYSVRIHFRGERENFSLYTGNKAAAAVRARDIYTGLGSKRWQTTQEQFKSAAKLTAEALRELPAQELKIFLLASMAGLRRNENDKLEWSAFRWEQSLLRIENSMHFQTKNERSRRDVDLDPELSALFHELCTNRAGPFVIESPIRPRRSATYRHYRCNKIFNSLFTWRRSKGVSSLNPLHALRKEFGSRINDVHEARSSSIHGARSGGRRRARGIMPERS